MLSKEKQYELRELWLKALESGKYKQTRNVLVHNRDGHKSYCCLGVACKVYKDNVDPKFKEPTVDDDVNLLGFSQVTKALGLRSNDGKLEGNPKGYHALTGCNDGDANGYKQLPRMTFKKIAKFIRENYKAVFKD